MTASLDRQVDWKNVPTRTITAGGVEFAYRELGMNNPGPPVVFLIHLAAVLDNWDPRVVDGFAASRRVITFDNRGVGASSGAPATSIERMATDAITFIKAMGFEQVDLFGFSMGGMIAQEIALMEPQLVRKMIIAGTGPAGGEGISQVARVTYLDMVRGLLTHQDPNSPVLHQDAWRDTRWQRVSGAIEGTLAEPRQRSHPHSAAGAAEGPAPLGLEGTGRSVKDSPACAGRKRR
jgi:pimeloyl-ACP methyl ester carboxylesterase